nr:putative ribonuclease H-like domain-containing protein [Tanacetum cinerariifolium]
YLKQAQQKQQSSYDEKVLFEKHDPPAKFVGDFKSLAKVADESLAKHKALELEIERLLRAVVSDQKDTSCGMSANTKFAKQSILGKPPKVSKTHALSKPVTSNSIPTPQGSKVVKNVKVIALGMFRINPFKTSREEKHVSKKVRASVKTNPITVSQPPVITKKVVNSDSNGLSSTGVDNTKTRRPQPRSNTKNDRVPSASKSSCSKNKEVDVEEHHRKVLLSRNKKHMSSECNNVKLATQNENQKKQKPKVKKPKKVGSIERLASPKPSKPRSFLRWSPTGRMFNLRCKIIASSESESQFDCSKGDNACNFNPLEPTIKQFLNPTFSLAGTVRFGNDHIATILGFDDLQWENILITRVYFVEGLGHNLFSVGQFCDSDLEVAFRRNTCFVKNLEGVDLLKGNRTTNLYTINLHEMASTSLICLMARASSTKSWLWHQRLSHLNFDTINDLAKNDLVFGLPKFKYHKDYICSSCEKGKSKRASHPPKPILNSRQRLHLLHMDLCGPVRIASINGKRYVLVIVDDYSRYTWVHFLISKDETPEVIKTFLKRITVHLQSPVIIIRSDNDTEFKNQVLKEYFDSVCISHQVSSVQTPQQNGVVERRNQTLVEAARTMLIFSRAPLFLWAEAIATAKPDISFLYVFGALCYPKNDREDIGKLGAKGLDLTYAPSTITTQQPTEGELDLLLEAMYDDYIGGQPSTASRTVLAAQAHQVPTRKSNFTLTQKVADNVPNAMFDANTFVNPFATPSTSAAESSSSQYVDPSNMHKFYQPYPHKFQWTKDHCNAPIRKEDLMS